MSLTPEQIAKIRQKEAETPDALKRNPLNDYTEGWFHVVCNGRSKNWTLARALSAVAADPWIGRNPERCRSLQANVSQRLKRQSEDGNALALDYVGTLHCQCNSRRCSLQLSSVACVGFAAKSTAAFNGKQIIQPSLVFRYIYSTKPRNKANHSTTLRLIVQISEKTKRYDVTALQLFSSPVF